MIDLSIIKNISEPVTFLDDNRVNPEAKEEIDKIVAEIKAKLEEDKTIPAMSAPLLGYNKRIFCIRFADTIKTFINPIIKTRSEDKFINVETNLFEGKQVAIARPKEVTVVYYTDELKVEDNKLLDLAAAIFTQQYNLLDGIVPGALCEIDFDELKAEQLPLLVDGTYSGSGFIFDPNTDEHELEDLAEYLANVMDAATQELTQLCDGEGVDEELQKTARNLRFTENVILGKTKVIDQEGWEREKKIRRNQKKFLQMMKKNQLKDMAIKSSKKSRSK